MFVVFLKIESHLPLVDVSCCDEYSAHIFKKKVTFIQIFHTVLFKPDTLKPSKNISRVYYKKVNIETKAVSQEHDMHTFYLKGPKD